jgi:hypothetical protein
MLAFIPVILQTCFCSIENTAPPSSADSYFIENSPPEILEFFYPKQKKQLQDFLNDETLPKDSVKKLKIYYAKNYDTTEILNSQLNIFDISELYQNFLTGNFYSRTSRFSNFEITIVGRFSLICIRRAFPLFEFEDVKELKSIPLDTPRSRYFHIPDEVSGSTAVYYGDDLYFNGLISSLKQFYDEHDGKRAKPPKSS